MKRRTFVYRGKSQDCDLHDIVPVVVRLRALEEARANLRKIDRALPASGSRRA